MNPIVDPIKSTGIKFRKPVVFMLIILLLITISLRFVNLDKKFYWYDEATSLWRISGYTLEEVRQQIGQGQIITVKDLQKYQHISPEKTWIDTIKSVAEDDLPHSPFYFLLVRFWMELWGDSLFVIRSFSVGLSILVLVAGYLLSTELFSSSLAGWITVIIFAVSPFHFVYAQEARTYSLWMLTTLLSSLFLWRSLHQGTRLNWWLYALSLTAGLYTSITTVLLAFGNVVYVAFSQGFKLTKKAQNFLLALLITSCLYSPWLWVVISNGDKGEKIMAWTKISPSLPIMVIRWIGNLSRLFIDMNLTLGDINRNTLIFLIHKALITLGLVGYSLYFIYQKSPKKVSLFVITLVVFSSLPLVLLDLCFGGQRSSVMRYLIPSYLGIQLAVVYLISNQLLDAHLWRRRGAKIMLAVLVLSGLASSLIISQTECAYNKGFCHYNMTIAKIVNQSDKPLILSEFGSINIGSLFSLSYILKDQVKLQLVVKPNMPNIPDGFTDIFVYDFTNYLANSLAQRKYQTKVLFSEKNVNFIRLEK